MRHLSHLLVFQGEITTAKRTLKLYVQLVSKARQTNAGDVSLQLKRRPTDDPPAPPSDISAGVAEAENVPNKADLRGPGLDADSDETFVLALVWGVAVLARHAKGFEDAKEIEEMATLARTVASEAALRDNKTLAALAIRAQGIASMSLALHGE